MKLQREGFKVVAQPLHFNNVDNIYSRLKTGLLVLQFKTGSKGINLSEALFCPVELERNFSSCHVVCILFAYLLIFIDIVLFLTK